MARSNSLAPGLYIMAGDMFQANEYATRASLARGEWQLLNNPETLYGGHNFRVAFVGTWRRHPNARAILRLLETRGYIDVTDRTL